MNRVEPLATLAGEMERRSHAGTPVVDDWQTEMRRAFRDPVALCRFLQLSDAIGMQAARAADDFPLFAPYPYVRRIRIGDTSDPLLRQVLPLEAETTPIEGFVEDPVADQSAQIRPGVIHKYSGRVLLVASAACAIHCRYCFRRHFPYSDAPHSSDQWRQALQGLASDTRLREVILSGGDPLTVRDEVLDDLIHQIEQLPHVRRLRIHSRLPTVIPQRITHRLLARLASSRLHVTLVLHVNHARELDSDVDRGIASLQEAGVWLLNQSVLLRGVNDDVDTLEQLSEALVDRQVVPYYLHQLDRVRGAAHFDVPIEQGQRIVAELKRRLPGYAVPRYVQDRPGADSKQTLA